MRAARARAFLILLCGGLLFSWGVVGLRDSATATPISESGGVSIVPLLGKRVSVTGVLIDDPWGSNNGKTFLQRDKNSSSDSSSSSKSWFSDADNRIAVKLPMKIEAGEPVTLTGLLTAAPPVPGCFTGIPGCYAPSMIVDAIQTGSFRSPVDFRDFLDGSARLVMFCAVLLTPLWLRSLFILLSPSRRGSVAHQCPCCGYDCRGSPLRCPECGSPVGAPNFRLDLNPKA